MNSQPNFDDILNGTYLSMPSTPTPTILPQPIYPTPDTEPDSAVRRQFYINAKCVALTYPDWRLPKLSMEFVRQWAAVLGPIEYIIMAEELHQSGIPHYHMGLRFGDCVRTRNARYFDIRDQHANVQSVRSWQKWKQYCQKTGNFIEWGADSSIKRSPGFEKELVETKLIIDNAKSMNKLDFLAWMSSNHLQYGPTIWDNAHRDSTITITQENLINGALNPIFMNHMSKINWDEGLTLIIVGDSGIGKTTYAKRLIPKPCLFISHIDDLKKFEPEYHKSILFDDVKFTHYPPQSQIHLVDFENPRSIHIRYGVARIPAGVFKVFTCNEDPLDFNIEAVRRRCQIVRCNIQHLRQFDQ